VEFASSRTVLFEGTANSFGLNVDEAGIRYIREIDSNGLKVSQTFDRGQACVGEAVGSKVNFVYMDDYRSFQGSILLDQLNQRKNQNQLTDQDRTVLMLMELSGLPGATCLIADDDARHNQVDHRSRYGSKMRRPARIHAPLLPSK
jgi:hypothetical protein